MGETVAQKGGMTFPKAHGKAGAELASPQCVGAGTGRARASFLCDPDETTCLAFVERNNRLEKIIT